MFEADKLPHDWVAALNNNFDAVVVPHKNLVSIYEKSGVHIPIFVIPLPIYLEPLLKKPLKKKAVKKNHFYFGTSSGFAERKNYDVLLEAFAADFGKNQNVTLKLHGSWGDFDYIKNKIKKCKLPNVEIIYKTFCRTKYINFLSSLDAYVFPSKGEGFSLTVREALALGLPCIMLEHTVHKDLCRFKNVRCVLANEKEPAFFPEMNETCGSYHQTTVMRMRQALNFVYNNYKKLIKQNEHGRKYVAQYIRKNLVRKFECLIKPRLIMLGKTNIIRDNMLITNKIQLYKKYKALNQKKNENK